MCAGWRTRGTNTHSAPASRNARPRSAASATVSTSGSAATRKASVRAFSTKPAPSASRAATTASTAATASASGRIPSSRLAPTAPAASARRVVSPGSP